MSKPSSQASKTEGIPVIIWVLVGLGALGFVFFMVMLAAIVLPGFLEQANRARQSEAKTYVRAMVRSEQAHFLEKINLLRRLKTCNGGLIQIPRIIGTL